MKPAVVFKRDLSITTFKFLITGCKFLVATLMRADKKMLIFNFYFLTVCVSTERIKILAFFCFNWVWPSRLSVITHWRNEKKRESPRLCVAEWNFHFASRYVARCTLTIELSVTLVVLFVLFFLSCPRYMDRTKMRDERRAKMRPSSSGAAAATARDDPHL